MKHLPFFLFLSLFPVPLIAAGKQDVKVRFLAERLPDGLGPVVLAAGEQQSAPFDLPRNNLSPPIKAPARAFSLRSPKLPEPLAPIILPENGDSFIALLLPVGKGYQAVIMRSDDPGFRGGDVYFHNHSDKTVMGRVGTAKFILSPAKGKVLRPSGAEKESFYNVRIGVREEQGDKIISSTRWPVEDHLRSYVFFFINPITKRVDWRAVDEFVSPEKRNSPGS